LIFFLDTCAIDAVEMREPNGSLVSKLVDLCKENEIEVFCSYASSNERQPYCTKPEDYMAETSKRFRELLIRLNLDCVKIKKIPLSIWGEFRWDEACWSDKEIVEFANTAAKIMFGIDYESLNSQSINGWKNRRDVEIFLTFICNSGGILVTSDRHFLEKKDLLIRMAKEKCDCDTDILEPKDALKIVKELVSSDKTT
jgi:hypothetical protein